MLWVMVWWTVVGGMIDFMLFGGFDDGRTDGRTDRQTFVLLELLS